MHKGQTRTAPEIRTRQRQYSCAHCIRGIMSYLLVPVLVLSLVLVLVPIGVIAGVIVCASVGVIVGVVVCASASASIGVIVDVIVCVSALVLSLVTCSRLQNLDSSEATPTKFASSAGAKPSDLMVPPTSRIDCDFWLSRINR